MNRRGFLRSVIGLAATAALPKPALAFLAKTKGLPDAEFRQAALHDEAIINLIEARMKAASLALMKVIEEDLYNNGTV